TRRRGRLRYPAHRFMAPMRDCEIVATKNRGDQWHEPSPHWRWRRVAKTRRTAQLGKGFPGRICVHVCPSAVSFPALLETQLPDLERLHGCSAIARRPAWNILF